MNRLMRMVSMVCVLAIASQVAFATDVRVKDGGTLQVLNAPGGLMEIRGTEADILKFHDVYQSKLWPDWKKEIGNGIYSSDARAKIAVEYDGVRKSAKDGVLLFDVRNREVKEAFDYAVVQLQSPPSFNSGYVAPNQVPQIAGIVRPADEVQNAAAIPQQQAQAPAATQTVAMSASAARASAGCGCGDGCNCRHARQAKRSAARSARGAAAATVYRTVNYSAAANPHCPECGRRLTSSEAATVQSRGYQVQYR